MIDISIRQIIDDEGKLSFQFPRYGNSYVTGAEYAAQKFAKILLTNPGTDKTYPDLGGGLQKLLGTVYPGTTYEEDVESAVINSLSTTSDKVKKIQANIDAPRKDTFVDYNILNIYVDRALGSAECSVRVRTFEEVETIELDLT